MVTNQSFMVKPEEKIMTLHPQGKNGVNISRKKYDQIKQFILSTLKKRKVMSYD